MTQPLTLTTPLRRNPTMEAVEMDGDLVMMDLQSGQYFGLNPLGKFIWNAMETPKCAQDLIDSITRAFEPAADQDVESDVLSFLQTMMADQLVLPTQDA